MQGKTRPDLPTLSLKIDKGYPSGELHYILGIGTCIHNYHSYNRELFYCLN